jgi:hypothetical protein
MTKFRAYKKCEWGDCMGEGHISVEYPARCGSGRCWQQGSEILNVCRECAAVAAQEVAHKYPEKDECILLLFCDKVCC